MKYILTIAICIFCVFPIYATETKTGITPSIGTAPLVDTNKTKNDINAILKQRLPEAELVSFKQIPKNGTVIYECEVSYQDSIIKLYANPQNNMVSNRIGDEALFSTESKIINKGTKEVNNILKQIKLDASFSDVTYNKKDKTMEGSILYMDNKYYFKLNVATGEIIDMRPLD